MMMNSMILCDDYDEIKLLFMIVTMKTFSYDEYRDVDNHATIETFYVDKHFCDYIDDEMCVDDDEICY
jgi:hypothetical protein